MNYKIKYLKYKNKYLNLQNQIGGVIPDSISNDIPNLSNLPDELKINILLYLPLEKLKQVRQVNKYYKNFIDENRLLENKKQIILNNIIKKISSNPIDIFNNTQIEINWTKQKLTNEEISELLLKFITNINPEIDKKIILQYENNKICELYYEKKFYRLFLKNININYDIVTAIAAILQINLPIRLKSLELTENNINNDGLKILMKALKINKTLTLLDLDNNNIGDEGAKVLAETLKQNSTLENLYINRNNISDEGAIALAIALRQNLKLKKLYMNRNKIGNKGAKALAIALTKSKNIETLGLGTEIDDYGIKKLTEALSIIENHNKKVYYNNLQRYKLSELFIEANNITDNGIKILNKVLEKEMPIYILQLWKNGELLINKENDEIDYLSDDDPFDFY